MKRNSYILIIIYILSLWLYVPLSAAKKIVQEQGQQSFFGIAPRETKLEIAEYSDPLTQRFGLGLTSKEMRELSREARIDRLATKNIIAGNYGIPLNMLRALLPNTDDQKLKGLYRNAFRSHIKLLFNSKIFFKVLLHSSFPLAVKRHIFIKEVYGMLSTTIASLNLGESITKDLYQTLYLIGTNPEIDKEKLTKKVKYYQISQEEQNHILDIPNILQQKGFYSTMNALGLLLNTIPLYSSKEILEEIGMFLSDLEQYDIVFNEAENIMKKHDSYYKENIRYSENIIPNIVSIPVKFSLSIISKAKQMVNFVIIHSQENIDYEKLLTYITTQNIITKIVFTTRWHNCSDDQFTQLVQISNAYNNGYNITDNTNTPLLSEALYRKNAHLSRSLIENDAWWNTNQLGETPLHFAAMSFDNGEEEISEPFLEILKQVLTQSKTLAIINKKNQEGTTPLIFAVENNFSGITQLFLQYGADPNIADDDGDTPLIIACQNQNIDLVEELLKSHGNIPGAHPSQKNLQGKTPLIQAWDDNNIEIARLLLQAGVHPDEALLEDNNTLLLSACAQKRLDWVTLLVEYGANIHHKNINGESPLSIAENTQDQELLLLLTRY